MRSARATKSLSRAGLCVKEAPIAGPSDVAGKLTSVVRGFAESRAETAAGGCTTVEGFVIPSRRCTRDRSIAIWLLGADRLRYGSATCGGSSGGPRLLGPFALAARSISPTARNVSTEPWRLQSVRKEACDTRHRQIRMHRRYAAIDAAAEEGQSLTPDPMQSVEAARPTYHNPCRQGQTRAILERWSGEAVSTISGRHSEP
jgi:hypothetical protein